MDNITLMMLGFLMVVGLLTLAWWGFLLLSLGGIVLYLNEDGRREKKIFMTVVVLSAFVSLYLGIEELRIGGKIEAAFQAGDGIALTSLIETGPVWRRERAVEALAKFLEGRSETEAGFKPAVDALTKAMQNDDSYALEAVLALNERLVLRPEGSRFQALFHRAKHQSDRAWRPRGELLRMFDGKLLETPFRGKAVDAVRSALKSATGFVWIVTEKHPVGVYIREHGSNFDDPNGTAYEVTWTVSVVDVKNEVVSASTVLHGKKPPEKLKTSVSNVGNVIGEEPSEELDAWLKALPED